MLATLLLVLACAQRASDAPPEAFFAPSARWSTAGGTPAKNGTSLAPALREEPLVAWSVDLGGPLEGEPLVWDGRVVAVTRKSPDRRVVVVLELATGRVLLHRELSISVPLEPALFGDVLAVRAAEQRVDLLRIGARLSTLRSFTAERSISPPALRDGELYLRVDDSLVRYDLERREAVWTATVEDVLRGTPAVELDSVFALAYDGAGRAFVLHLARSDGRVLERIEVGGHGGRIPEVGARASLHLLPRELVIEFPLPVASTTNQAFPFGRLARSGGRFTGEAPSLHPLLVPPVPLGTGWVALEGDARNPRWIATRREGALQRSATLAQRGAHPELLAPAVPATHASGVIYLGGLAADAASWEVLWKRPSWCLRPVPAEGFLLVVEEPERLSALCEPLPALAGAERDARSIAAELERELAEGYALLAQRSLRAGDPELSTRLLATAAGLGARGRAFELAQDGLDRLLERLRGQPARPDPRGRALVLEEERELAARPGNGLFERAQDATDPALERALLRELLARDPGDPRAGAAVRSKIPPDAPVGDAFDAESWLDFLDVEAKTPVRFLDLARAVQGSSERAILERQASEWRPDLVGFRTDRLHVVTAPGRPGAVARALDLGERMCELLEQMFLAPQERRELPAGEPMTLLLYADQREYVEQSRKARSGPEAVLGWTVGHYNGGENLSRMFVPEEDGLLREFLGTYAHELTHHWLATRAPFATRVQPLDLPGYWVAEGFATMVEEFRLDVETGAWSAENPRAHSLDFVANAPAEALLPWETFFALSPLDFAELGTKPKASFPLAWRLGVEAEASEIQLFYAQAAAAAHYLFRTSEGTKRALFTAVEGWYRGDRSATNPAAALGITPSELGARIRAFAREAVLVAG